MGRRAKEKQLVAQASRRRTVLQIDRVSRREVGEGPTSSGTTRAINPNSITGIGLLGSYADHSDEEEAEKYYDDTDNQNSTANLEEQSAVPSTSSLGPHSEIDAKLADFFSEIASIDADTASTADDGSVNRQPEEAVSSTTGDEQPAISSADGYEQGEDYSSNAADMYPWQACLDENTNCYYYWNVETNEVQWHPPELVSAVPDTQTADDSIALSIPQPEDPEEVEQGFQEVEDSDANKGLQSEEQAEDASDDESREANSKSNSDNELDGFQVVDSWEDKEKDVELSEKKKVPAWKSETTVDDEEVPAKKRKLVEVESDDSDDDFAAQLLEDTYEKGKQEVLDERGKDLSEEGEDEDEDEGEDENVKDKDQDSEDKPLLPPEVFKHLKTAATGEKKEEKPVIEEKKPTYDAEEDFRLQIMELTSVLTNKLNFLEVSRKGMSSLKILLIEMETRISDWREGALDSQHLVHKLYEADNQLKQYEESAAPPDWTCHWDRYCISHVFCQGG